MLPQPAGSFHGWSLNYGNWSAILFLEFVDLQALPGALEAFFVLGGAVYLLPLMLSLGVVLLLQGAIATLSGDVDSPIVSVLSTLMIAALFNPLRRRVQRLIDRRFYRRKNDAAKALYKLVGVLQNEVEMEHVSREIIGPVQDTLQPAHVDLWLRDRQS